LSNSKAHYLECIISLAEKTETRHQEKIFIYFLVKGANYSTETSGAQGNFTLATCILTGILAATHLDARLLPK
jgi:hypothetical protein